MPDLLRYTAKVLFTVVVGLAGIVGAVFGALSFFATPAEIVKTIEVVSTVAVSVDTADLVKMLQDVTTDLDVERVQMAVDKYLEDG